MSFFGTFCIKWNWHQMDELLVLGTELYVREYSKTVFFFSLSLEYSLCKDESISPAVPGTSTRPCHHCSIRESLLSEGCWWHCCGVPREPQRQEEVNMTLLNSQGSGMRRYIDLGVKRFFLKSMYIKDIYKKFMENQGRHLVQQLRRCLRCPRPILVLGFKYQLCSIF